MSGLWLKRKIFFVCSVCSRGLGAGKLRNLGFKLRGVGFYVTVF